MHLATTWFFSVVAAIRIRYTYFTAIDAIKWAKMHFKTLKPPLQWGRLVLMLNYQYSINWTGEEVEQYLLKNMIGSPFNWNENKSFASLTFSCIWSCSISSQYFRSQHKINQWKFRVINNCLLYRVFFFRGFRKELPHAQKMKISRILHYRKQMDRNNRHIVHFNSNELSSQVATV